MDQKEVDQLLDHLVNVFSRAWNDDIDDDLAAGTLNAIAGDFLALHVHLSNKGVTPTDWM